MHPGGERPQATEVLPARGRLVAVREERGVPPEGLMGTERFSVNTGRFVYDRMLVLITTTHACCERTMPIAGSLGVCPRVGRAP